MRGIRSIAKLVIPFCIMESRTGLFLSRCGWRVLMSTPPLRKPSV